MCKRIAALLIGFPASLGEEPVTQEPAEHWWSEARPPREIGFVVRVICDRNKKFDPPDGHVNLWGSRLNGIDFRASDLKKVDFTLCNLRGANFSGSSLRSARFIQARLEGAIFNGADLADADLRGAHLGSVDLTRTKGLSQRQLDEAVGDERTKLPEGLASEPARRDNHRKLNDPGDAEAIAARRRLGRPFGCALPLRCLARRCRVDTAQVPASRARSRPRGRRPRARQVRRLLASPELVARTITAVRRENGAAEDTELEESEVIEALGALEPVWDELYPAEQARILRLLIERIDVAPDGISVTLHAAGIRSLVAELADQEAPALAASEPLLEAAE